MKKLNKIKSYLKKDIKKNVKKIFISNILYSFKSEVIKSKNYKRFLDDIIEQIEWMNRILDEEYEEELEMAKKKF